MIEWFRLEVLIHTSCTIYTHEIENGNLFIKLAFVPYEVGIIIMLNYQINIIEMLSNLAFIKTNVIIERP